MTNGRSGGCMAKASTHPNAPTATPWSPANPRSAVVAAYTNDLPTSHAERSRGVAKFQRTFHKEKRFLEGFSGINRAKAPSSKLQAPEKLQAPRSKRRPLRVWS